LGREGEEMSIRKGGGEARVKSERESDAWVRRKE